MSMCKALMPNEPLASQNVEFFDFTPKYLNMPLKRTFKRASVKEITINNNWFKHVDLKTRERKLPTISILTRNTYPSSLLALVSFDALKDDIL